jgi:hypothetical protein
MVWTTAVFTEMDANELGFMNVSSAGGCHMPVNMTVYWQSFRNPSPNWRVSTVRIDSGSAAYAKHIKWSSYMTTIFVHGKLTSIKKC